MEYVGRPVPASLTAARQAIATIFRCPDNLGIELRPVHVAGQRKAEVLAVFIDGLADEELVQTRIVAPLQGWRADAVGESGLSLADLRAVLPAPRVRAETDLATIAQAILAGVTAVFLDGAREAILVETSRSPARPAARAGGPIPDLDVFDRDLIGNVALLRQRLRDPALVARPLPLPEGRGSAALVYLEGRATRDLLDRVCRFALEHAGEEAFHRGLAAGASGKWGLLPRLLGTRLPEKVAPLLDVGHVAIFVDGLEHAFLAPVTVPALLYSATDATTLRPISAALRLLRTVMGLLFVTAPAAVVSLMNYHQEMMPTQFLLGLAAVREQAPFPVVIEVLFLESMQEIIREIGFHLPGRVAPGLALVAGKIIILLLVQGGIVGTVPAVVSIGVTVASLGLLPYDVIYMGRVWRLGLIVTALSFGFFGIAAGLFAIAAYLTRAESFGVPVLGETGLAFTAPTRRAARPLEGDRNASPVR